MAAFPAALKHAKHGLSDLAETEHVHHYREHDQRQTRHPVRGPIPGVDDEEAENGGGDSHRASSSGRSHKPEWFGRAARWLDPSRPPGCTPLSKRHWEAFLPNLFGR